MSDVFYEDDEFYKDVFFEVDDDIVIKYTHKPELGEHIYKCEYVMTKEIFQECYIKWVEPQESEDNK